ncbi:MAG: hypothetical protein IH595_02515 [Bacteroidales bacterium]|nr:hypothetical protein [Bacteroidales bacterium]
MRAKLFLLLISLAFFSCTQNAPKTSNTLTEEEKNQEATEISTTFGKMVAFAEQANLDSALTHFADTTDFVYILNGYSLDYPEFVNQMSALFKELTNQKYDILHEKITFPDKSLAFYTANCTCHMYYKNGDTVTLDPYVQFFTFKKIDNKWKVIYGVESFIQKSFVNGKK